MLIARLQPTCVLSDGFAFSFALPDVSACLSFVLRIFLSVCHFLTLQHLHPRPPQPHLDLQRASKQR